MDHITRRTMLKRAGMTVATLALPTGKTAGAQALPEGVGIGPDYTSKIPKFTFANTLKEQEAQLKTNLFIQRFAESRKKLAKTDRYRTVYHFTSPESFNGDPNGLCFWRGQWHLFYQAWPVGDHRQHWGHAVSDDLTHWRDLPYAIYPHPEKACFSGGSLVEDDRVIVCYHGWEEVGNMIAISSDPLLLNWDKLTGMPVVPSRMPDGSYPPYGVFDPCIWKKDGTYYMLSTGKVLRSKDLENWEYLHPFVENDRNKLPDDDYSCPSFYPIGDRHIMVYFSHKRGPKYVIGDYDTKRDKFFATDGGDFNFGAAGPNGLHAPSATTDGKGGIILMFCTNNVNKQFGGQYMMMPRHLTLDEEGKLRQEPTGDIESLRYDHQSVGPMELPGNKEIVLENIKGNAMEIIAEIECTKESSMVEMNVFRSPDKEEFTRIAFFRERGVQVKRGENKYSKRSRLVIDSSYSTLLPQILSRAPEAAPILLEEDEPLKLRVFLDKSSIEVFANGKQCLAMRVYPSRDDSVGVSLRSQGKGATLKQLDAWQMKSIYE
jgi:beta-fructofuranosidase